MRLESTKNPILFFSNGVGDYILNLPAIRALAETFRGNLTFVFGDGPHRFLFDRVALRRRVALPIVRDPIDQTRIFDAQKAAFEAGECDLFISLTPWFSKSIKELLTYLDPFDSVGFFPDFKSRLHLNYQIHSADLGFEVARLFRPLHNLVDFAEPPTFPFRDWHRAKRIISMLPSGSKTLAVHADTGPDKMWPIDRFGLFLDGFLSAHEDFFVLQVGSAPLGLDKVPNGSRIIPCRGLPLATVMCLVAQANFFLGVDSCMLHVADFCRVPSIGIFGPTQADEFGFRLGPNITIQADGGMRSIEVEMVRRAIESMLICPHQSETWNVTSGSRFLESAQGCSV